MRHDEDNTLFTQLMDGLKYNHVVMDDYPQDTCILWIGTTRKGLPVMRRNSKTCSVRKEIWKALYHEEPDGLLSTECKNRACVNPHHICYIQSLTTHCRKGHEYVPQNTRWRVRKDKGETKQSRECLTCYKTSKKIE